MDRLVVIGSCNIDHVLQVERLPGPGETVLAKNYQRCLGGKGANQAIAARKAGAEVIFICKLGKDQEGQIFHEALLAQGLPEEGILRDPQEGTGTAWVMVDDRGKNQIVVFPGANRSLLPADVAAISPSLFGAKVLLLQLEIPLVTVEYSLEKARRLGMLTILNPAPASPLSPSLLGLVDILTPNETEASILTGIEVKDPESAKRAAQELIERGVRQVIVTLGDQGAFLRGPDVEGHFPAFPVEAIDTTAAGDAFNGALASALAQGKALAEALSFANAAGALATTRWGAQPSLPGREEIEGLLKDRD